MTGLVLGGLIAAIAVLLVALPYIRRTGPDADLWDAPSESEEARLLLIEERDRSLAALKELEFDHRTGKIDDVDYRAMVVPLRRAAAEALRALDARMPKGPGAEPPETTDADPAAEALPDTEDVEPDTPEAPELPSPSDTEAPVPKD